MTNPASLSLPAIGAPARRDPILLRVLAGVLAVLRAWREERRTMAILAELDAATLRDLGLDQGNLAARIQFECDRGAAWQRGWEGRP